MYTPPLKAAFIKDTKKNAVGLFKQRRPQSFWKARCAGSCARNHSFVCAHREPLETSAVPCSFLRLGFSSKRRAQSTFPSNGVRKACGKLDAPHLVLVTIHSCALVVSR